MQIGWSALSLNVWHETRRGLDAGKFANSELVEQIFPYAKNAMIALNIGRGLLFLISLKWHHVTKLNYYYEMVSFLVECLLPYDVSNNISQWIRLLMTIINFLLDYFHFVPALIFVTLQFVINMAARHAFFEEPIDSEAIFTCVFNMIVAAMNIWGIHMVVTKWGMIFVDAEVLRTGNEQLLNNLEEGVIIQEEEGQNILFQNTAAKMLNSRKQTEDDFEISLLSESLTNEKLLDREYPILAHIPTSLFKQPKIEVQKTFEDIKAQDSYVSIREIIDHAKANNFPGEKSIYKLIYIKPEDLKSKEKQNLDEAMSKPEILNRFFAIKVKEQIYLGKPSIAIYIRDYTKKIREKLLRLQRQEEY